MDERSQHEIAEGLQAGVPAAWSDFYRAHAARLWHSVAALTGAQSAEVADIVQEAFLAAARSARRYDPQQGTLWQWLWGITRKELALHYRKSAQRAGTLRAQEWWAANASEVVAAIEDSPPEQLASRELQTLVRVALSRLPAEDQALLSARYLEERSTEELAADAGLSVQAVYSRLARARRAFRNAFDRLSRRPRRLKENDHERART